MSEAASSSDTPLLERAGLGRAPWRLGAWVGWGWGGAEKAQREKAQVALGADECYSPRGSFWGDLLCGLSNSYHV